MIEVLFGESEAASMKVAKNTLVVICLGFMLDVGDIKEEVCSEYRKQLLGSLLSQGQWGNDPEMDAELQKVFRFYVEEEKRLKRYLKDGETVRIWYSDAPYSRCGFYNLCNILKDYENDVRAVKMPEYRIVGNSVIHYQNWGDVAAEEFSGFLSYEKLLTKDEQRTYSHLWAQLKEENSFLRAVVNGKVVSVPETFYDFLIWQNLPAKPIIEARLIGNILGHYPIGVGDWWYAKRINHFIEQGKIKVVQNSEKLYARTICPA